MADDLAEALEALKVEPDPTGGPLLQQLLGHAFQKHPQICQLARYCSQARQRVVRLATLPWPYFEYSNGGIAFSVSFVAPGSKIFPSPLLNWLTGIATWCVPRPRNPPTPMMA